MSKRNIRLKDDPDEPGMNEERSGWVADSINLFKKRVYHNDGEDDQTVVSDFLADLGHYCDTYGVNLEQAIHDGREHYEFETQSTGKQFSFLG